MFKKINQSSLQNGLNMRDSQCKNMKVNRIQMMFYGLILMKIHLLFKSSRKSNLKNLLDFNNPCSKVNYLKKIFHNLSQKNKMMNFIHQTN